MISSVAMCIVIFSCHSGSGVVRPDSGATKIVDSSGEWANNSDTKPPGPVDVPNDVFEEGAVSAGDIADLPGESDYISNDVSDMWEQDQYISEDIGSDALPGCPDGAVDIQDCERGGKKVRHCHNGVWGPFSDCLDVTSRVIETATKSQCASYSWRDRGKAPIRISHLPPPHTNGFDFGPDDSQSRL